MSFSKILGQEKAINSLKGIISSNRIPPAILFYGLQGIGKFMAAKEFAKVLNCQKNTYNRDSPHSETIPNNDLFKLEKTNLQHQSMDSSVEPCDMCQACIQIEKNIHPDVRIIDSAFQGFLLDEDIQKQTHLKIDTVREFTRYIYTRPITAKWKVFIINDADTLTTESQNAMLKVLEEPPQNSVLILIASQKNFLLQTVLSRCHPVHFKPLTADIISDILFKNSFSIDEATYLGEISNGSIRQALNIKKILSETEKISPSDPSYAFKIAGILPKELYIAREYAKIILEILISSVHKKWIEEQKNQLSKLLNYLLNLRKNIDQNVSPDLIIESAVMQCIKQNIFLHMQLTPPYKRCRIIGYGRLPTKCHGI